MKVGGVVMIQDTNCFRGQWRIGILDKVKPGSDGIVRNCTVKYKNARPGKSFEKLLPKWKDQCRDYHY